MDDPRSYQAFLATGLDYDQNEITEAWEVFESATGRTVARLNSEEEAENYLINAAKDQINE